MQIVLGFGIIGVAVYAVWRRVDVRLALFPAALALGALAGQPMAILRTFVSTFADGRYIVPICCSMGFAYVLNHTGCDRHLVHLLTRPIRRVRAFLIPGTVLLGFAVNMPIISQTSTAVAVGSVIMPLLRAAQISPATAGAALLLGASIGGELLNPGAPEYSTIARETESVMGATLSGAESVYYNLPMNLAQLAVATLVFWITSLRIESRYRKEAVPVESVEDSFKVSLIKALVPLIPLVILFLVAKPLEIFPLPPEWLVDAKKDLAGLEEAMIAKKQADLYDSRLIGLAMMVGTAVAALTSLFTRKERGDFLGTARAFFDGAGYAFKEIVAIIVVAACFAEGVTRIGIGDLIGHLVTSFPALLVPAAGFLPMAFAAIGGSGIAATQGLFKFFAGPAYHHAIHPAHIGAIVSLGSAAGRTMSPVAAVNLMCAQLAGVPSAELVRRVAPPLLAGLAASVLMGMILAPSKALPVDRESQGKKSDLPVSPYFLRIADTSCQQRERTGRRSGWQMTWTRRENCSKWPANSGVNWENWASKGRERKAFLSGSDETRTCSSRKSSRSKTLVT